MIKVKTMYSGLGDTSLGCTNVFESGLKVSVTHYHTTPYNYRYPPPPKYIKHSSHPPSGSAWADLKKCAFGMKNLFIDCEQSLRMVTRARKSSEGSEKKTVSLSAISLSPVLLRWAIGNDVHRCQGRARLGGLTGLNGVAFLRDHSVFKALRFIF